jgi:hypothetical protein
VNILVVKVCNNSSQHPKKQTWSILVKLVIEGFIEGKEHTILKINFLSYLLGIHKVVWERKPKKLKGIFLLKHPQNNGAKNKLCNATSSYATKTYILSVD